MRRPDRRPPLSRRLAFALLAVLLLVVVIELISWTAFWVMDGRRFSWRRMEQARARLSQVPLTDSRGEVEQRVEQGLQAQVLHPYLGFVTDPDSPETHDLLERYNRAISEQGFFQPLWASKREITQSTLVIGIFGGSVATIFAMQSEFLVDALHEHPDFAYRDVVVRSFATPGYRQPQQVLALAYHLAQGERLDLIINIDGFNEVALPIANNLRQGVHPLYPMDWAKRVRDVPDPVLRRRVGELAHIRHLRSERAAAVSSSWARLSITNNLLWRVADDRLSGRQATLESELAKHGGGEQSFLLHGPRWADRGEQQTYRFLAEMWQRSSRQMHQLCEGSGARYLHVLQPNQYVAGSKPMGAEERRVAIMEPHPYRRQVEEGYPLLLAAGQELRADGIDFLDLTRVFAEVQEPLYIDACCHFGWQGNRIVARAIAEALLTPSP